MNVDEPKCPPSEDEPADVPMDPETLAGLCKALSHPARLRILAYLRRVDGCICGEIVSILPLSQATVSQHLKVLKAAGLIRGEIDGPRTCYCLVPERLSLLKRAVAAL
jgi:DNA-binding transcriptional ArsR family regulator